MREKELHKKNYLKSDREKYILVLFNDEINTFDHVIKSLVKICGHNSYQAEQCALLTHFKGSCDIKTGSKEMLHTMSKSLKAKGLKSKVESI